MRYDRDDDMIITGKRHDFRIDYTCGFDANGKILALDVNQFTRCGWAQDLSLPVADRAMLHADSAYFLPNVRIESHRLKTNMQSATAYRGFGGPQGILGMERIVDHIAHDLGLDPLIVRQRNFYAPADGPSRAYQSTPYGQIVEDSIIADLCARLVETSDYTNRRAKIAEWNATNPLIKKGIALTPLKFGISYC